MKLVFENTDLLSIKEAALQLKISKMTLYRWIKNGNILSIQVGAQQAIPKSEIGRLENAQVGGD